jgi:hypothetical protein
MYTGGFTDGNDKHVKAGDRVEYRFGARKGVLKDALQDGDAYVDFDDTKRTETVKWKNLCKIEE